jgi:YVTN family beta-propeller protein
MNPKAALLAIPVLLIGSLASAATDRVYLVLLKGASALAFLDESGKTVASIPVGQHPHEMVFAADGKTLYTADNGTMRIEHVGKGGNSISIIDVAARKKLGDISLGEFHRPHGLDIDRATGRLAVTTELPDRLLIVDPQTRKIVRHYDTKGKTSHMVTLGPGARWAYVSNSTSANVSAVNLMTGDVKLIPTAERPEGSTISPNGREVYVCNREAASVSVIDTNANTESAKIQTGKGPVRIAITRDGKTLVYGLMHDKAVGIADVATRKQTAMIPLGNSPVSLTLSHDGKYAFASAEDQDIVYVVDLAAKKVAREMKLAKGSGPDPVHDWGH